MLGTINNNGKIAAFVDELTLLYELCYACETRNHDYISILERELKRLKALYPLHSSIDMMEEWINEASLELEAI